MTGSGIRFTLRLKIWFYSIFGILFFSGVLWLIVHYYGSDEKYDSLKPLLLRVHGAAAMVSLLMLGVLIPTHMNRGWKKDRNRWMGIVIVTLSLLMIVSGYGLYYCGDDNLRAWISGFHSMTGSLLPLVLFWHIISGRKSKKRIY